MDQKEFYSVVTALTNIGKKIGNGCKVSLWPTDSGVIIQVWFGPDMLFPDKSVRSILNISRQDILSWRKGGIDSVLNGFTQSVLDMVRRDNGRTVPGEGWQ